MLQVSYGEENLIACRMVYHLSVPEAMVSRIIGLLMSLVVNPEVVGRSVQAAALVALARELKLDLFGDMLCTSFHQLSLERWSASIA